YQLLTSSTPFPYTTLFRSANGPFWAWNWLELGEHTGTHFDAPSHWITGKDLPSNTTDTIPPQAFVGPVNVIDRSKESAANPDYLDRKSTRLNSSHVKTSYA